MAKATTIRTNLAGGSGHSSDTCHQLVLLHLEQLEDGGQFLSSLLGELYDPGKYQRVRWDRKKLLNFTT